MLIIFLYPSNFLIHDYNRYDVSGYEKEVEVLVLDMSKVIGGGYSSMSAGEVWQDKRNIIVPSISTFRKIISEHINKHGSNIIVFNFLPENTIGAFLSLLMLKLNRVATLRFIAPGIPPLAPNNIKKLFEFNFKYIFLGAKRKFLYLLFKIVHAPPSYLVVAGEYYENKKHHPASKLIAGNSFDYDRYLRHKHISSVTAENIVFLDAAGPMFAGDYKVMGRRHTLTSDVWYPALVNLFNILEDNIGGETIIAAHPKAKHASDRPPYFDGRKVISNETMELIQHAKLVVTRSSTAVSYAVLFNKPILLILNNQMLLDTAIELPATRKLQNELGLTTINIDEIDETTQDDWGNICVINEDKYQKYIINYLSSTNSKKTNKSIILGNVLKCH